MSNEFTKRAEIKFRQAARVGKFVIRKRTSDASGFPRVLALQEFLDLAESQCLDTTDDRAKMLKTLLETISQLSPEEKQFMRVNLLGRYFVELTEAIMKMELG